MLSPMAEEDIKDLLDKGVTLTPAQIVRLNALALRVEHGAEAALFVHAPRVGWAGRTPIFEPTIQLQMWLRDFASVWWHGASLDIALAWACAHSQTQGFFAQWTDERAARKEIEKWQRQLDCTVAQLECALDYALNGLPQPPAAPGPDTLIPDGCPYADILADALAAGLGTTLAELSAQPRRIVAHALTRWMSNRVALAGGKPDSLKARHATRDYCAYDDYLMSLTPEPEHVEG